VWQPRPGDRVVRAHADLRRSPYDRYAPPPDGRPRRREARRAVLQELLECDHCHGGLNFRLATHAGNRTPTPFNNGLYNIGGTGAYPEPNTGLEAFTGEPRDMGRMKPPTLRNIELTAPYMHDGSMATLEEVIDHYERGGRLIEAVLMRGRIRARSDDLISASPERSGEVTDQRFRRLDGS
jgi:cytochrome c peroxidase